MDEGSEGRFKSIIRGLFKKNDLEEHILDARDDGEIRGEDVSMLLNILDFKDKFVNEAMIPRTEMVCAEADETVEKIGAAIVESGHSRIPLYRDTKDTIVGVLHAKDLLGPLLEGKGSLPGHALMRPVGFVTENMLLRQLLADMRARRTHLVIVLDNYGGTAGMVTMEDVLEEIVGDIEDEYDAERPDDITEMDDGSLMVSGQTPLEDLSRRLDMNLDSDQMETIGGYLTVLAGRIPLPDEFFTLSGHRFIIQEADAKHINTILVKPATGTGGLEAANVS